MLDIKNKYLKYKQKYLNLKKMIGGGIDASYTIYPPGKIELGNTLITLSYIHSDGMETQINYKIIKEIGSGTSGIVYLIKNTDETDTKEYIFKILNYKPGPFHEKYPLYIEGKASDKLEGILPPDMLVLFQGKIESDFLISTYNGNNLEEEFKYNKQKIKKNYANVTSELLVLLHKINSVNIFHNDIKLANITIKNDTVYLIDFGLLTKDKSGIGTYISMSYKGVIDYELEQYSTIISKLLKQKVLRDTDIFGFFYCCIDLLFLTISLDFSYKILFYNLDIIVEDDELQTLNRLFELYYFILPTSIRDTLPRDNIKYYNHYDEILPSIDDEAKHIFNPFSDDNINLFRFMAYIYVEIKFDLIDNEIQDSWYKEFLQCMSDCFLPTFNYTDFEPKFKVIVGKFASLSDVPDHTFPPASLVAPTPSAPDPTFPPASLVAPTPPATDPNEDSAKTVVADMLVAYNLGIQSDNQKELIKIIKKQTDNSIKYIKNLVYSYYVDDNTYNQKYRKIYNIITNNF